MFSKVVCILLLLTLGTAIYVLFRRDIIFVEMLPFSFPGIKVANPNVLMQFFIYNLPDALWYAALLVFMSIFVEKDCCNRYILCFAVILPFCLEAGQYFHLLKGTFDVMDVISYIITLIVCLWKLNLKDCFLRAFK